MTCLIFPPFDPDRQFVGDDVLASPLPTSVVPAASAASVRQASAIPATAPALLLPFTSSPPSGGVGYVLSCVSSRPSGILHVRERLCGSDRWSGGAELA